MRIIPLAVALCVAATAASAQDVVVMRRQVSTPHIEMAPSRTKGTWTPSAWTFDAAAPTCSDAALQVRTFTCVLPDGKVDPTRCGANDQPSTQRVQRYAGCTIDWVKDVPGAWSSTCSKTATRSLTYQCQRTGGDSAPAPQDEALCTKAKPASSETAEVTTSCTYSWQLKPAAWTDACGGNPTTTTTAQCTRQDGEVVSDGFCTGTKPAGGTRSGTNEEAGCLVANPAMMNSSVWSSTGGVYGGGWSGSYMRLTGTSTYTSTTKGTMTQSVTMEAGKTYAVGFSFGQVSGTANVEMKIGGTSVYYGRANNGQSPSTILTQYGPPRSGSFVVEISIASVYAGQTSNAAVGIDDVTVVEIK